MNFRGPWLGWHVIFEGRNRGDMYAPTSFLRSPEVLNLNGIRHSLLLLHNNIHNVHILSVSCVHVIIYAFCLIVVHCVNPFVAALICIIDTCDMC